MYPKDNTIYELHYSSTVPENDISPSLTIMADNNNTTSEKQIVSKIPHNCKITVSEREATFIVSFQTQKQTVIFGRPLQPISVSNAMGQMLSLSVRDIDPSPTQSQEDEKILGSSHFVCISKKNYEGITSFWSLMFRLNRVFSNVHWEECDNKLSKNCSPFDVRQIESLSTTNITSAEPNLFQFPFNISHAQVNDCAEDLQLINCHSYQIDQKKCIGGNIPALDSGNEYAIYVQRTSLDQLKGGEWLGNDIMDLYFQWITKSEPDVLALGSLQLCLYGDNFSDLYNNPAKSFHEGLVRRNYNLFDYKLVLVPICENKHWYLIAIVNHEIFAPDYLIFDSIGQQLESNTKLDDRISFLNRLLEFQYKQKNPKHYTTSSSPYKLPEHHKYIINNGN